MSRTVIDFGSSRRARLLGHASTLPVRVGMLGALILALAFCAAFGIRAQQELSELHDLRTTLSELQRQQNDLIQPSHDKAIARLSKEQLSELVRMANHLNTPWADVFALLERRVPDDVALISIEPDVERRSIRLQAEARTLDDLLSCADAFRRDPGVARVVVLQHQTDETTAARAVRLTFELSLRT